MPVIIAAGIAAAASLVGGLMTNAAENERAKQDRLQKANDLGFEAQAKGYQNQGISNQASFGDMMANYRSALGQ